MQKCIITGSTGFIGSRLVPILERDWDVFAPHREECDLSRPLDFVRFPKSPGAIIHLANSRNYKDFPKSAREIFRINTVSSFELLEYARKTNTKTFVLASTGGVGKVSNFYTHTKQCAEILSKNYNQYMNVVTMRFHFVYGYGQSSGLIYNLVNAIIAENPVFLHGNDGFRISPTHVSDAANAIKSALKLGSSECIDVSGLQVLTIREIAEIIGEVVGKSPVFTTKPFELIEDIIPNVEKMKKMLDVPKVRFREGIEEMVCG